MLKYNPKMRVFLNKNGNCACFKLNCLFYRLLYLWQMVIWIQIVIAWDRAVFGETKTFLGG